MTWTLSGITLGTQHEHIRILGKSHRLQAHWIFTMMSHEIMVVHAPNQYRDYTN